MKLYQLKSMPWKGCRDGGIIADTLVGTFKIDFDPTRFPNLSKQYAVYNGTHFDTMAAAAAAAQRDYEERLAPALKRVVPGGTRASMTAGAGEPK